MGSKKLGLMFIASVVLAFLAGVQYQNLSAPEAQNPTADSIVDYITEAFEDYYYYPITEQDKQDAFINQMQAVVQTYASNHDDPYTRLVAQSIYANPSDQEKFVGIGITYQFEGHNMRISDVHPKGSAHLKLYPNDLIVGMTINQQDIFFNQLTSTSVVTSYLAGKLNETKTFIVKDPDGNMNQVDVTYQEVLTPTAFAADLAEDDIAYIRITQFSAYVKDVSVGTAKVFSDALMMLEQSVLNGSHKTLILDLRDNPGGALSSLSNVGSTGLIPGIVQQLLIRETKEAFSLIDRQLTKQSYYGGLDEKKPYDIKILVNQRSASAAEVLAAALSINGGYELYGHSTYGKGVYQNSKFIKKINDVNYSLSYTEGSWFYGNDQNVAIDPLDVTELICDGIHAIDMPFYDGEMSFDDVSVYLSAYQQFFNLYFREHGREDGFFDEKTKSHVEDFQTEFGLEVTGVIDRKTAIKVHDMYTQLTSDLNNDTQLQDLIEVIKTGNAS